MTNHRNYKCPMCNGEFDIWDDGKCPFCGLESGKYPQRYTYYAPPIDISSATVCPICGLENGQHCLIRHSDTKPGEAIWISCPCPLCSPRC